MTQVELWTTTDSFPGEDEDQRLEFLNNAPMPIALANQLITIFHGDMAVRLAAKLYANVPGTSAADYRPTFSAYAHWASATVGKQLRSPIPSGRRRRSRALIDGNRDVAYAVGRAALAFLDDADIATIGLESTPLNDGFDRYRDAASSRDLDEKSKLILEGNEAILAFEQQLLEPHLGYAFRVTARRVMSPMNRFSTSQRRWRQRIPGPLQLRIENALARLTTHLVIYRLPKRTLRVKSRRSPARRADPPAGHTCGYQRPGNGRPRCWMNFAERMDWIVRIFHVTHHDVWFDRDETDQLCLERARDWKGFKRAWADYRRHYLSGSLAATPPVKPSAELHIAANDTPPRPAQDDPTGLASAADWAAATSFYVANRTEVFSALMARSIPATFASAEGAPVLDPESIRVSTDRAEGGRSRLIGDVFPRVANTVHFLDGVFGTSAERVAALERARDRHSNVREDLGDWRSGVPINQEHLLATVTTFVCPVRDVFVEFGFGADHPWDSWARCWAEIGVWLGADPSYTRSELVPHGTLPTYADMERVARRLDIAKRSRSLAGIRLMDNFVRDLSDGYPRAARSLPLISLWALGDIEVLRMLMVPGSRRGQLSRRFVKWAATTVRPVRWLWKRLRHAAASWILEEISQADQIAPFRPLHFFPPDCSVLELGTYEPVVVDALLGANVGTHG